MDDDVQEVPEVQEPPGNYAAQNMIYAPYHGGQLGTGLVYSDDPAEKLRFQAQQCLQVLREAHRIRQNPTMMSAIRDLIRHDRDELAAVLDEGMK